MDGKVPAMSDLNNLQIFDRSSYPELFPTEVEQFLIALNLIF